MDKYEYKQLSERMIELMQNEEYGEAKEIADSIDWRGSQCHDACECK